MAGTESKAERRNRKAEPYLAQLEMPLTSTLKTRSVSERSHIIVHRIRFRFS